MNKIKKQKKGYKILSTLLTGAVFFTAGYLASTYGEKTYTSIKNMITGPKISVIMSTYNRDYAISGAIDSILNQTMDDFELIIINDGSTDKTKEVLDYYAQKDERIVVIENKKNMGLVAGLNKGLDVAKGKYIIRMDDDDRSLPFRLERQFLAMQTYPHISVMGGKLASGKGKKPTGTPQIADPEIVELNTYFSSGLAHPTIIIRKDFLNKHNIRYDENYLYAEDSGLYKKVLENGGKISSLDEPVLLFAQVKKVNRPENYHYTQAESFKRLQKDKLAPFFNAPYEILGAFNGDINRCIILKEMLKANKEKNILKQSVIENRFNQMCPLEGENALYLSHPDWTAFVIIDEEKQTIHRKDQPKEKAKIIEKTDQYMTLKWDNYKKMESFVKNQKGEYTFSNELLLSTFINSKSYTVQHPQWEDKIIVLKNKTFFKLSDPEETGKILNETNKNVSIKWDKWPSIEIFQKENDTLIFEKEQK